MQKIMLRFLFITFFATNLAMDQKSLWVKTSDQKKILVTPDIISSSNLLTLLYKAPDGCNGCYDNPLIIPTSLSLNAESLQFYSYCNGVPVEILYETFPNGYYQLIDTAEKLKALKRYIDLIRKILPVENDAEKNSRNFSSHITSKWIDYLIKVTIMSKGLCPETIGIAKTYTRQTCTKLAISQDGSHILHNFCGSIESPLIEFYNTTTKSIEYQSKSTPQQRTYFSPCNNYVVILKPFKKNYLYDFISKKKHLLCKSENQECNSVISDNSKYILIQSLQTLNDYKISYALWHINEHNEPIALKTRLFSSTSAIFHPDNNHIIHINNGSLSLYNIINSNNITLYNIKNSSLHGHLAISPDKKKITCKIKNSRNTSLSDQINYVIFDIQNIKKVTCILTPLCYPEDTGPLHIPHKNIIVHCSERNTLLQLLDQKSKPIASYKKEGHHIVSLAINNTGDYCAFGDSKGTIVLWDLSNPCKKIHTKEIIISDMPIQKLRFTDNQLLLSQSKGKTALPTQNLGKAVLWDINGKEIINFGNSVFDAEISKAGNTIAIVKSDINQTTKKSCLNLICYNTDIPLPSLTLNQAYDLLKTYEQSTSSCLNKYFQ